jgi:hydrogenase/urease accessory protein HupE
MKPVPRPLLALLAGLFCGFSALAEAHSIPEIPVRADFHSGGEVELSVEINPRDWEPSPAEAPSLEFKAFLTMPAAKKEELLQRTKRFIADHLEFTFEPLGRVQPDFTFDYVAETSKPLKALDDAVVVRGKWKTTLPAGMTGWKIASKRGHKVSVVFLNTIDGKEHPRVAVLFPGESSFTLDLTGLAATRQDKPSAGSVSARTDSHGAWETFKDFLFHGYEHVLPLSEMRTDWTKIVEGLDHILFVLGLFLLSRSWKPVVTQVTAFTLAHSLTLGLAAAGLIHVPSKVVEPIIALSIAAVAVENIVRPRYTHWRLAVVFTFGAFHGLGFASGLSERLKDFPKDSFLLSLTGFNLGVEGAQLSVIALALGLTFWIKDETAYRRRVVIPVSAAIALTGLVWAVQRLF